MENIMYELEDDCCCSNSGRMFVSKDEKLSWLNEYKKDLENELKGLNERISELETKN